MLITMSNKEIQRLAVLQDVRDHRITQVRGVDVQGVGFRRFCQCPPGAFVKNRELSQPRKKPPS